MPEEKLSEREIAIRGRQAAGLSRPQAEQAQNAQDEHDANLAKAGKKPETQPEKKGKGREADPEDKK